MIPQYIKCENVH